MRYMSANSVDNVHILKLVCTEYITYGRLKLEPILYVNLCELQWIYDTIYQPAVGLVNLRLSPVIVQTSYSGTEVTFPDSLDTMCMSVHMYHAAKGKRCLWAPDALAVHCN